MKLITFIDEFERENVGVLIGKGKFIKVTDLTEFSEELPELGNTTSITMIELIKMSKGFIKKIDGILRKVNRERLLELSKSVLDYKILAPIPRPPIIYALARNYRAHAEEAGLSVPKEPAIFIKAPTSVIGPGDEILVPKFSKRVDYEAELAVIIGKKCKNVSKSEAMNYVFGYTCLNDVTARDIQLKCIKEDLPWDLTKSIDTFTPMGPCVVTKDQITNPHNLKIELRVNGIMKQSSNTKYMIFQIPEIIEYISEFVTLEPGTVITTGTPEGIGKLRPGDIVEVEIEGIGVLRNKVA